MIDTIITICHFPPASSPYAIHSTEDSDPLIDLIECISRFSALGNNIVLGDFNAQTREWRTPIDDSGMEWTYIIEIYHVSLGLQHIFEDRHGPLSIYGHHLL